MRISAAVLAAMMAHVTAVRPEEGCGLLSGKGGMICRHYPIPNLAHSPHRFRMDPQAQIDAMYAIVAAGEEILAIYHSHPHGPATLSPTDLAELPAGSARHVVISWQQPAQPQMHVFALYQMSVTEVMWHVV